MFLTVDLIPWYISICHILLIVEKSKLESCGEQSGEKTVDCTFLDKTFLYCLDKTAVINPTAVQIQPEFAARAAASAGVLQML